MENKLRVSIRKSEFTNELEIYIGEKRFDGMYIAKPVELVLEKHIEGENLDPTIKIGGFLADEFLKVLAEELDNKGIKTDKDERIKGTLDATKYHLEDLRKLLKLIK